VASLIVVGTIVIALSTFTDAAKNLLSLVVKETRPDINGEWKAEVIYDWNRDTKYTETFTFRGDGEEVYGTASFLRRKRGILEGKVRKNKLTFLTKTREVSGPGWDNQKDAVHRYHGEVFRDEIKFIMQTEGGFFERVPIEFTARKVPDISLQPTR
jgi:hypothetical protein